MHNDKELRKGISLAADFNLSNENPFMCVYPKSVISICLLSLSLILETPTSTSFIINFRKTQKEAAWDYESNLTDHIS